MKTMLCGIAVLIYYSPALPGPKSFPCHLQNLSKMPVCFIFYTGRSSGAWDAGAGEQTHLLLCCELTGMLLVAGFQGWDPCQGCWEFTGEQPLPWLCPGAALCRLLPAAGERLVARPCPWGSMTALQPGSCWAPAPRVTPTPAANPWQVAFRSPDGQWDGVTVLFFLEEVLCWRHLELWLGSGAGSFSVPICRLLQNAKNTPNISPK